MMKWLKLDGGEIGGWGEGSIWMLVFLWFNWFGVGGGDYDYDYVYVMIGLGICGWFLGCFFWVVWFFFVGGV